MSASKHLTLVASQDAASLDLERPCRSVEALERLQGGWRPGKSTLANAQHAQRWTVRRHPDANLYQFVGYASQGATSIVIATVLAIDPQAGWALLTYDRWMTLGRPLPETEAFDPIEVARGAAAWLGCRPQWQSDLELN